MEAAKRGDIAKVQTKFIMVDTKLAAAVSSSDSLKSCSKRTAKNTSKLNVKDRPIGMALRDSFLKTVKKEFRELCSVIGG